MRRKSAGKKIMVVLVAASLALTPAELTVAAEMEPEGAEATFLAESGIKTRENIVELEKGCVNAVLIGETFMRSENKEQMLQQLKGE